MSELRELVDEFIALVEAGQTVQAMERFYAEDVIVFENRELARAGRAACMRFEQEQLAALQAPPRLKAQSRAINERDGHSFIEWTVRFASSSGRSMLLEEVAVQKWDADRISQERFYYEGFVDEGQADGA